MTELPWTYSLYTTKNDGIDAIIVVQVDDTICASRKKFADEEEIASKELPNKRRVEIKDTPVRFNGMGLAIVDSGDNMIVRQLVYIKNLNKRLKKI